MTDERNELTKQFMIAYDKLDEWMRARTKSDERIGHAELIRRVGRELRIFHTRHDDLMRFAHLRNVLVHNAARDRWDPIADPHPAAVRSYVSLVGSLIEPANVMSLATRKVYSTAPDHKLIDLLTHMAKEAYTDVPVLVDGKVAGVFTEGTMIAYAGVRGEMLFDNTTTVRELEDFYGFEHRHTNERFSFVSRKASAHQVEEIFVEGLAKRARIAAVFVTDRGRRDEKLLGIVTAFDVAAHALD